MVPLRQVADIVESASPQIIKRQELQRRVGDLRNAKGGRRATSDADVQKLVKSIDAAARLPLRRRRPARRSRKAVRRAMAALGARGDLHLPDPGVAVRQLPAAARDHGVAAAVADRRVAGAAAHRTTLNIFSMIGVIMLMGLVTKNAILLVDFANRVKAASARDEALLQAGRCACGRS